MQRISKTVVVALVALAGFAPSLAAQTARTIGQGPTPLVMTARNETAVAARRDSTTLPGDVVRYSMRFTNVTAEPVQNVKLDNPLPKGLEFVGGSIRTSRPDVAATFSADGGKTFSAQPMETVVVDGQRVTRPIPAERYTHVRWVVSGSVAPRATVTAEYSARVAGSPAAASAPGTSTRAPRR